MNKRVLTFGIWFQWKKHINYFINNWYVVDWVTRTWSRSLNTIRQIYLYQDLIDMESDFFNKFDVIVIAVHPIDEQEKVVNLVLKSQFTWKVIVEKPVVQDMQLMKKISLLENFYFFFDECILSLLYKKVFIEIKELKILLYDKQDYINIFEHAISPFLSYEEFWDILKVTTLEFWKTKTKEKGMRYCIISQKHYIIFDKWKIFLNWRHIKDIEFGLSLSHIMNLTYSENLLIKSNFCLSRLHI